MLNRPQITHIIYDLDGLLLNTEPLIFDVAQAIANRYGKSLDPSVRAKTAGRNARDSAQILIDWLHLPLDVETYLHEKSILVESIYPLAEPMPGAVQLTRHLQAAGIPQAVATSSAQRPFQLKTSRHAAWFDLFDKVITGDDPAIQQGKPAPDIFLLAAQTLGADPSCCLVFEDSLAGVAAGRAAGMAVVAVPDSSMEAVLYQAADQIIPSLLEFAPESWSLPAF